MRLYLRFMLSVLAAAPLAVLAAPFQPPWNDIRVKHTWDAVPENWESLGHPPTGTTIDLHIALKPHREDALIDALYEVSDPEHPKYGVHLSREQVAELVAPHPRTLELVNSWLEHNGVPPSSISMTHGGSWLTLTGVLVSHANELLGSSYELYQHARTNETIVRTVGYALPVVLHTHVQTVAPTTFFASPYTLQQTPRRRPAGAAAAKTKAKTASGKPVKALSRREDVVTPSYLRWMYNTYTYAPAAMDRNVLGIAGYLDKYPSQTDLTTFMTEYLASAEAATFTVAQVNGGGYDPNHPAQDANVGIQYASAIAYPTTHIYYSTGGGTELYSNGEPAPGDVFLEWTDYVLGQANVPQTVSMSIGIDEKDCPLEYAKAVCNLFAQLGARGTSVLVASGDDGVGYGDCRIKDGSVRFIPLFPASCPYVTSVGGTTSQFPQVGADLSGGGFSNYFPRPAYQNEGVPAFLSKLGRQYRGIYNRNGRGIPDLSSQALNFVVVVDNVVQVVNGTRCAVSTMAGIISLLNDFLISNGKNPLGFLNPWLYGHGLAGLDDIIYGYNPGCGTNGFFAANGWDPVTGLGTIDFFEMQHVIERIIIQGGA